LPLIASCSRLPSNRIEGFGRSCLIPDLSRRSGNRFAGGTGVPVAASKKGLQIEFFPDSETGYITWTPARRICGAGTGGMYLPAEARREAFEGMESSRLRFRRTRGQRLVPNPNQFPVFALPPFLESLSQTREARESPLPLSVSSRPPAAQAFRERVSRNREMRTRLLAEEASDIIAGQCRMRQCRIRVISRRDDDRSA
jgi:hypothetical protein